MGGRLNAVEETDFTKAVSKLGTYLSNTVITSGFDSKQQLTSVLEKIGGPYRDRTCGPLMKRRSRGITQVVEKTGNPPVFMGG